MAKWNPWVTPKQEEWDAFIDSLNADELDEVLEMMDRAANPNDYSSVSPKRTYALTTL